MSERFSEGDHVLYDEDEGWIVSRSQDRPDGGDLWRVRWANGVTTTVWGSDLVKAGIFEGSAE